MLGFVSHRIQHIRTVTRVLGLGSGHKVSAIWGWMIFEKSGKKVIAHPRFKLHFKGTLMEDEARYKPGFRRSSDKGKKT